MVKLTKVELNYIKDMSGFYESTQGVDKEEKKIYTDIIGKCSKMEVEIDLLENIKTEIRNSPICDDMENLKEKCPDTYEWLMKED